MLAYSNQIRAVSSIALSFQSRKKINVSVSNDTLERDKIFLKPKKYQTFAEGNFKFISLWTIFKYQTSKIDTLKLLQDLDKEDIKEIMKEKEKILLYQSTIENDYTFMKSKVQTPDNVLHLFKTNQISSLYLYWYFVNNPKPAGRLNNRTIERISLFLEYFPKVKEYLEQWQPSAASAP
jgi:hypothetical protein